MRRFIKSDDGSALVEFAFVLPMMLLVFGILIEGGRIWSGYQATSAGLRDATRYLSRVVQPEVCQQGGVDTARHDETLARIIRTAQSGEGLFPAGVGVTSVASRVTCHTGAYRLGRAPVAEIEATLAISLPFAGLIRIVGGDASPLRAQLQDQARVVGS